MKNKKKILIIISMFIGVIVLALASSYAIFTINVTKNTDFKIVLGNLELKITDTNTEDKYILENIVPTKDSDALKEEGYTFTVTNTGTIDSYYTVYLDDIILSDAGARLNNEYVKVNLYNHKTTNSNTRMLSDYPEIDRVLARGLLKKNESITYTLRMWVDYNVGNDAQSKYIATQIRVVGEQQSALGYQEEILNGATPVLTENLVPVQINDNGVVTKADINEKWYSYEEKKWANAVVLKNDKTYKNGEKIPEEVIESYFVWIPKYSYQLWDLGNYDSLTAIDSTKPHAIPIKFGLINTSDSNTGECTTPGVAGESGNCKVGDYMTHPAFLAFDTNGLWVGKFETGYDGATSTEEAQTDTNKVDVSKIVIKSNTYSWRNINVGNSFKNSHDYLREDDSHMMKNTEWGAVAYLSHSLYGTCEEINGKIFCSEIRINNNSSYITGYAAVESPTSGFGSSDIGNRYETTSIGGDGEYTVNYLNNSSTIASTTRNYTGIYDMSGGSYEYVMGYTTETTQIGGESEITILYSDFFKNNDWQKYYDKYFSTSSISYFNRIIGDATGENGPFTSQLDFDNNRRNKSSWYLDYSYFVNDSYPWFYRGDHFISGTYAGVFSFSGYTGNALTTFSFRIVLAPTK